MRHVTIVAMAILMVGMVVAAGSVSAGASAKITITFWNGFTASDGEVLREIVNRFNLENRDNIQIKMDIMPWDVMLQKLPPAIATRTAPSFVLMDPQLVPQYVANNALQPLDDIWQRTNLRETDFAPNVLELFKYRGRFYEIPMQYNLIYLYWNKTLFRAAGLDPERPPQTWEELAQYAVRLTDPRKNQFGFGMPVKTAPQWWTSLIWGNGGEFFDLQARKSLLDSPENLRSLEFLQDLAVNKRVTPRGATGPELDNLMTSGKLAMYINGPWLINGLRQSKVDFGIAAPPRGTVRHQVIMMGVGFAVPSTTSAEEKAAAYKFIEYWNSTAVGKEWTLRNGFPPYLISVINDPDVKADPVQQAIAPLERLGRTWAPGFQNASLIDNDVLWPLMEAVITGAARPADALRAASEKLDMVLRSTP